MQIQDERITKQDDIQMTMKAVKKLLTIALDIAFYGCLTILAWVFLQVFVFTSFKVPSDSMEPALVPGDNILVDKCSTGARLFHLLKAANKEDFNIYRTPGWRDFRRNDVLVFNFPYPGRWDSIAFDVMLYYVKRCVAVPGDTLEMRDAHLHVRDCPDALGYVPAQDELQRLLHDGRAEDFGIVTRAYPNRKEVPWTIGEFGPLYIPKQGSTIGMDSLNVMLYRNAIEWEQRKKLRMLGDTVLLGDSVITCYRFRRNYYFVAGDKALNSRDSRYFGLLPEEYIVGRAVRVWKSVDPMSGAWRWDRFMKRIE